MATAAVQASTQQDAELMKELLRQRGLLATGGNIRALPFADGPVVPNANGNEAAPGDNAGSVPRPEGMTPVVDENDNLVDPSTGMPLSPEIANDWWKYLLGGAGIAGGAVLADMLRRRMGKGKVPTIEGETLDPLAPTPEGASPIVNGEYTEVNPSRSVAGPQPRSTSQAAEALAGRSNARALPSPPLSLEAASELARSKARPNPRATSDTSVVRSSDLYSDLTPEELARAKEITKQLVANRVKGNKARAKQSKFSSRAVLPTGDTDEKSLLNTVVRLLRENGALRSATVRAIP